MKPRFVKSKTDIFIVNMFSILAVSISTFVTDIFLARTFQHTFFGHRHTPSSAAIMWGHVKELRRCEYFWLSGVLVRLGKCFPPAGRLLLQRCISWAKQEAAGGGHYNPCMFFFPFLFFMWGSIYLLNHLRSEQSCFSEVDLFLVSFPLVTADDTESSSCEQRPPAAPLEWKLTSPFTDCSFAVSHAPFFFFSWCPFLLTKEADSDDCGTKSPSAGYVRLVFLFVFLRTPLCGCG